jgi:hypothetical protein
MRKQHTTGATCSSAKAAPPPPPAATRVRSCEPSAAWLEDDEVTLLEDTAELGMAAARVKRDDDTLRIWCPRV